MALQIADFDYDLPPERIALRPAVPRDAARLMVAAPDGPLLDRNMADLASLLRAGDMLVFNDTRVIAARLKGRRRRAESDIAVEATLHRRLGPRTWTAFMRPGKRLRVGDPVVFGPAGDLEATVQAKNDGGEVVLQFAETGDALDRAVEAIGAMPLPPYIAARRPEDARDRADYQTVYAARDGSVAAPTAGLHFTPALLQALADAGVGSAHVTLHVGAGTFLPVKADRIDDHVMHAETGCVSADAAERLNRARASGGRIVCVGTTSLRLLESCLDADGRFAAFEGDTAIFLRPGTPVRAADGLLTNFHLPRSTLLMLVAALVGMERLRAGYAHALAGGYRFYSYGDAGVWWAEGRG